MSIDLNAPEIKEAIKAAIEEATSALVAKRDELLSENKKLKQGRQIDPADVQKLEEQIEALKSDLTKSQKVAKDAQGEAEKATKAREASEAREVRMLVENGLTEQLTKLGVTNPVHLKAAKSMLASQVQVVAEGDVRVAKVGDKKLADFAKEWASGEEGKFFVTAAANTGGGAGGGGKPTNPSDSLTKVDPSDKAARLAVIAKRLESAT